MNRPRIAPRDGGLIGRDLGQQQRGRQQTGDQRDRDQNDTDDASLSGHDASSPESACRNETKDEGRTTTNLGRRSSVVVIQSCSHRRHHRRQRSRPRPRTRRRRSPRCCRWARARWSACWMPTRASRPGRRSYRRAKLPMPRDASLRDRRAALAGHRRGRPGRTSAAAHRPIVRPGIAIRDPPGRRRRFDLGELRHPGVLDPERHGIGQVAIEDLRGVLNLGVFLQVLQIALERLPARARVRALVRCAAACSVPG